MGKMRRARIGRSLLCTVVVVVGLWGAVCDAARKVDIRIVPRPRSEVEKGLDVGPIPFRPAAPATGPYSYYVNDVGCIKDSSVMMEEEQRFLLDVCHLKNVTIIEDLASRDTPDTGTDSSPTRKILGMFRGWHIDPISKKYKIAIFDDGDLCGDNPNVRYAIHVELVPSTAYDIVPHAFGFREVSECTYAIKVELYISDFELTPINGIHTDGVLDLSDPEETIEHICGMRKCKYDMVEAKMEEVKKEVGQMKRELQKLTTTAPTSVSNLTVSTASLILRSSTGVMEKALELLHSIEDLYATMQPQVPQPVETREVGVGTESDPPNGMDSITTEAETSPEMEELTSTTTES